MKKFSFIERLKSLSQLQTHEFDLLIIGGGITGAGAARDAALRGLRVGLIESRDFASGTSSRSSKLIHGGIRYLENLEFRLVFEALNERTKLFEMCPHLVHPLRFMIPLYEESRVSMFRMGLGMWLYDALSLFQAPEMHERLSPTETLDRMPALRGENLRGSYIYSDGYMDDDRLVHETLRSAHASGAIIANYTSAQGAEFDSQGHVHEIKCRDEVTGREFRVRTRHVISSVGPWTDLVGPRLLGEWKKVLRPTKGIHLTLPKNRLPLKSAVVMGAEKSDRIVFGIPRHEMIIIGTTDTDFPDSPETVTTKREDVDYLLAITKHYFPGAKIQESDLIASYAGVRPLVHDGSATEGKTSREHVIWNDERGFTFVAGGKYTTYRLMAKQVVEKALESFSPEEKIRYQAADTTRPLNAETAPEAFHQALHSVEAWSEAFARDPAEVRLLAERYGMEAESILSRYDARWTYPQIEAAQAIETTMCLGLVDFYSRRVPFFLADPLHGLPWLDEVGAVFQQLLKWDDTKLQSEKAALKAYIAHELSWKKQNT